MAWDRQPPPIFEGEDELQLKLQYARLCAANPRGRLRPDTRSFPARTTTDARCNAKPGFTIRSFRTKFNVFKRTTRAKGLPIGRRTKAEVLRTPEAAIDDKDKIAAYKLYLRSRKGVSKGGYDERSDQSGSAALSTFLIADARSNRPIAA
jgi:hypothetical protein